MANSQVSTFHYRLITWALFPVAFAHAAYTSFKYKNLIYFRQRFAHYPSATATSQPIWCHCASVGEINTALPLLQRLINQGESLIITTNTPTGHQTLVEAKLKNSQHVFLPLDYSFLARRFIKKFQPKHCFIFETELWPNILLSTLRSNIGVVIVNGRISEKTLKAPAFLLKNYQRILFNTHKIISSSEENTARFISLGARTESIITLDNLKFAASSVNENKTFSHPLNFPYLLCASTHEGEEDGILSAWAKHTTQSLGLVIAIRHPQRIKEVIHILENLKLPYHLHSNKHESPSIDSIYIIDTLGELMPFIAHANIVFMGGSLVPVGGHNMLEPALYKRCIFTGPHYHNFKMIVNDLLEHRAIEVVSNAEQLIEKSLAYESRQKEYSTMGENAYRYIKSKQQVLNRYEEVLLKLTKPQAS